MGMEMEIEDVKNEEFAIRLAVLTTIGKDSYRDLMVVANLFHITARPMSERIFSQQEEKLSPPWLSDRRRSDFRISKTYYNESGLHPLIRSFLYPAHYQ